MYSWENIALSLVLPGSIVLNKRRVRHFHPFLWVAGRWGRRCWPPLCRCRGPPKSSMVPAQGLNVSLLLFSLGSTPQLAKPLALAWLGNSVGEWQGMVDEFGSVLRWCLGVLLLGWWVSAARCGLSWALELIAELSTQSALRDICGSVTGAYCKVFLVLFACKEKLVWVFSPQLKIKNRHYLQITTFALARWTGPTTWSVSLLDFFLEKIPMVGVSMLPWTFGSACDLCGLRNGFRGAGRGGHLSPVVFWVVVWWFFFFWPVLQKMICGTSVEKRVCALDPTWTWRLWWSTCLQWARRVLSCCCVFSSWATFRTVYTESC